MKPDYLKKNDTIALIAPSYGCTTSPYYERINEAIKNIKKLGYKVLIGPNVFQDNGIASSNVATLRAKEFMDVYKLDEVKAIWSVGGGETMLEMLPYVNFNELKKYKPKWFIGYSDNTCLTYLLTTLLDIETIYGICFPTLFDINSEEVKDSIAVLEGKKEFKGYPYYESIDMEKETPLDSLILDRKKVIIPYNYKEPFSGTLVGGCLDVLQFLCGTKFDNSKEYTLKQDKVIFFLEACDLLAIGIRRALFQLKNAGWFNNVSGFVIGRSLHEEPNYDELPEKSFIDLLKEYNVPILLNCDLGHLHPTLPFRTGAKASVEYKNNNIYIKYKE